MRGQRHAPAAFTPGKDPVHIVQEAGWATGPVWTGAENLAPTRIRSPDRPAGSQSLYRLNYPAHFHFLKNAIIECSKAILKYAVASKVLEKHVQNFMPPTPKSLQNFSFSKFVPVQPTQGSRKISPFNLNISIIRNKVVSFANWPHYQHGNGPRYLPNSYKFGPQLRSEQSSNEKSLTLADNQTTDSQSSHPYPEQYSNHTIPSL